MTAHPLSPDTPPAIGTLITYMFFAVVSRNVLYKSVLCPMAFPATGPLHMLLQGSRRANQKTNFTHVIAMILPEVDRESVFLVLLLTFIAFACWMY